MKKLDSLQKLLTFAFNETQKGNDCFLDFDGHSQCVTFRAHVGKWSLVDEPVLRAYIYLNHKTDKGFEKWVNETIEETTSKIQSLTPAN